MLQSKYFDVFSAFLRQMQCKKIIMSKNWMYDYFTCCQTRLKIQDLRSKKISQFQKNVWNTQN